MNLHELSLSNLQTELNENLRLRVGLWTSLGIFLFWVSLVWSDFNADLYKTLYQQQLRLVALQDIESSDVWASREQQSASHLVQLRSTLWQAESEGLAKAKLQAELAKLSGVSSDKQLIKVGVPQPLTDIADVVLIRARLGVSLAPDELLRLIEKLQTSARVLQVDQFNLKDVRGNWNIEVSVTAYFDSAGWAS